MTNFSIRAQALIKKLRVKAETVGHSSDSSLLNAFLIRNCQKLQFVGDCCIGWKLGDAFCIFIFLPRSLASRSWKASALFPWRSPYSSTSLSALPWLYFFYSRWLSVLTVEHTHTGSYADPSVIGVNPRTSERRISSVQT